MKEAVSIQGDSGSRIVFLNTEYCNTPSLPDSEDSQVISTNETEGKIKKGNINLSSDVCYALLFTAFLFSAAICFD